MEPAAELAAWAAAARWRHLWVELAGVFWVAAELLILVLVCWGREHLATAPHCAVLRFTPAARRNLWLALACMGLLSLAVAARAFYLPPPTLEAVRAYALAHLVVWAGFVTVWVALECAIVYHGWRGYRVLGGLLGGGWRGGGVRRGVGAGAVLALAFTGIATAQAAALHAAVEPWQNALYFYLRAAGVVWIAVEWIAAWVLWRSYALLRAVR